MVLSLSTPVKHSEQVWERLEDVDGGASTFVDSDFIKSSPAGGDFAGRSAEAVRGDYEADEIDAE